MRRSRSRSPKYGGDEVSLPLITYTPRYHEVQCEYGKVRQIRLSGHYGHGMDSYVSIPIKCSFKMNTYRHDPPLIFTVDVIIDNSQNKWITDIDTSFLDTWYIVYGCINPNLMPDGNFIINLIDNFGSIHRVGHQGSTFSHAVDGPVSYVSGLSLKQLPILPDSFIDSIVEKFASSPEPVTHFDGRQLIRTFPSESMIPLKKPEQQTPPHRKFEPTADLASYIQKLEMCLKQSTQENNSYRGNNVFLTSVPPIMLETAKPKNE